MTDPVLSLATLARRVALLEQRLAALEGSRVEAVRAPRRDIIGARITLGRIAAAVGVPEATEQEIDRALDEESCPSTPAGP